MKAIVLNGVPCLHTRSVGSHSTSGREKEGKNEVYTPSGDRNSITIAKNGIVSLDTRHFFDPNLLLLLRTNCVKLLYLYFQYSPSSYSVG